MQADIQKSMKNVKFPSKLAQATSSQGNKDTNEFKDSTKVKWVGERTKNSGPITASGAKGEYKSEYPDNDF